MSGNQSVDLSMHVDNTDMENTKKRPLDISFSSLENSNLLSPLSPDMADWESGPTLRSMHTGIVKILHKLDSLGNQHSKHENRLLILEDDIDYANEIKYRLEEENNDLRKELDLVKAVVCRQSKAIDILGEKLCELEARSMRENLLFHNIPENGPEDTLDRVCYMLANDFGFNPVPAIERAHRIGPIPTHDKTHPRMIVVKFLRYPDVEEVLRRGRNLQRGRNSVKVTPQYPTAWVEQRKSLGELAYKMKTKDPSVNTKLVLNKLYVNNERIKDPFPMPSTESILQQGAVQQSSHTFTTSKEVIDTGSVFQAAVTEISGRNDALDAYKEYCSKPLAAQATHVIAAVCVKEPLSHDTIYYHQDNGEHGAGRAMIREIIKADNIPDNIAIFITRQYGGTHLGPRRFKCMKEAMMDAIMKYARPLEAEAMPDFSITEED